MNSTVHAKRTQAPPGKAAALAGSGGRRRSTRPPLTHSKRSGGSCACGGRCPRCRATPAPMPPVSRPGEASEREADRVAERVLTAPRGDSHATAIEGNPGQRLARKAVTDTAVAQSNAAPIGELTPTAGMPLDRTTREFFEARFGRDFSGVRLHTDMRAADTAQALRARAFTVGQHIGFSAGHYAPHTSAGKRLLAHELTHAVQQTPPASDQSDQAAPVTVSQRTGAPVISRAPLYPDSSCDSVKDNITRAWPTARDWVRVANSRLSSPESMSGALQTHFRIDASDPAHAADLGTVRAVFERMQELFDTDIDNRCTPTNTGDQCTLPDGRKYAAWVHAGVPADGITHCLASADVGLLSQEQLIETLVHEVAHLADTASTDYSYRHQAVVTTYSAMTRAQAIHNGDSYSEFARDQYVGTSRLPLLIGVTTGVLLSSGQPRWAIGASYDIRSRSGIEVFDLVGGLHMFIALDPAAQTGQPVAREFGGELNIGAISRSADTRFFADTRLGGFVTADLGVEEPVRAGLSSSTVIGWADSGFRFGINLRLLFDFLHGNNAVIIGGQFNWGP